MIQIKHSFVRFVLVGVTNSLIGLSAIYLAWRGFGAGDLAANAFGYGIGFLWSYWMNSRWTFRSQKQAKQSVWRYAAVCAVAYAVNLSVIFVGRVELHLTNFIPHAAGLVVYTVIAYLGSRFLVFTKKLQANIPPS